MPRRSRAKASCRISPAGPTPPRPGRTASASGLPATAATPAAGAAEAPGSFMVRGQGWKYWRHPDGDEYLYDLPADPGETRNLAREAGQQARKRAWWRSRNGWSGPAGRASCLTVSK